MSDTRKDRPGHDDVVLSVGVPFGALAYVLGGWWVVAALSVTMFIAAVIADVRARGGPPGDAHE